MTLIATVDEIIQAIICDVAIKGVEADAVAMLPFLGLPIINPLFRMYLNSVGQRFAKTLVTFANIEIVKFETEQQKEAYEKAISDLHAAPHDEKKRQAVRDALSSFVCLNNE